MSDPARELLGCGLCDLTARDILKLLDGPMGDDLEDLITLLLIEPELLWYWKGESAGPNYSSLRRNIPRSEPAVEAPREVDYYHD